MFVVLCSITLTSTHLLKMNFQFLLQGAPLDQKEAAALMTAAQKKGDSCFSIDLEKVIDVKVLDTKKLFDLAIEQKFPELASLAVRVSVAQNGPFWKAEKNDKKMIKKHRQHKQTSDSTPEDIIESLHKSSSYWAVGAASILLETGKQDWITMREIALNVARDLDKSRKMPKNSILYKGFTRENGVLVPLDLNNFNERKTTFHVSPIYIGLREGLVWCVKHGLIEQKRSVATSAANINKSMMSRVYYRLKATDKAKEVRDLWGDLSTYIESFYKVRLAH